MEYYDYFEEPSEFEQQIDEFKESLVLAVKKEHQDEIERLRKENAELKDTKSRMREIENEHKAKISELERERQGLESKIKRIRLDELLSENFLQGWGIENHGEKMPKCDKCDDRRRLHYKTPRGMDATEQCECDKRLINYEPIPMDCYRFYQAKRTYGGENYPGITRYFKKETDKDYDEYNETTNVYDGKPFDDVKKYGIVFIDEEKAKEYCRWLNSKEAQ